MTEHSTPPCEPAPQPVAPPTTRIAKLRGWFRYYGHGPAHALHIVVRETRQYLRHWLSREVFFVACERCGTIRKVHERNLPDTGQLFCPTCQNEFDTTAIRAFLNLPASARSNTFHKRIYYDHEEERHRELDL